MHPIAERLSTLSLELPNVSTPVANYVPYRIVGDTVWISGQLPFRDGTLVYPGTVGVDVSVEQAYNSARQCGLHLLAQVHAACEGDWGRFVACVKLGGTVQAREGFTQHPEVINGASDLMVEVLGDAGRHARFAVGASSLPRNACVEIDAVFAICS